MYKSPTAIPLFSGYTPRPKKSTTQNAANQPSIFVVGLKTFAWFDGLRDWVVGFHETEHGLELRIVLDLKNRDNKTLCFARWTGVGLADLPLDATELLIQVEDPDQDVGVIDLRPGCKRITAALEGSKSEE